MARATWADVTDLEIVTRHLDARTEAIVRDWFEGRIVDYRKDGERSVVFAHPDHPDRSVKIKGAGLKGAPVHWGELRRTGPKHPVFDFDGRMTEDVSFGHDAATVGGASFQQVTTEWMTSAALAKGGEDVVPCLGYGRLRRGGHESWFSVMSHEKGWRSTVPPDGLDIVRWEQVVRQHGTNVARIAREHGLLGYFWYLASPDGRLPIKDVHPFRRADPFSMSAMSWVMAVYYGIHISCNTIEFAAIPHYGVGLGPEAVTWPLSGLCPDVTLADHARLRAEIVAPYMVTRPEPFDSRELWHRLCDNKVTAALIDLCPPEFVRP